MCRQCDDAPCAQVCPNNAIVHEDGHIKVIQSRCIGCKTCVIACPYGAMNVVTEMVEEDNGHGALFKRKVPRSRALKCDLCAHQAGGLNVYVSVQQEPSALLTLMNSNNLAKINAKPRP